MKTDYFYNSVSMAYMEVTRGYNHFRYFGNLGYNTVLFLEDVPVFEEKIYNTPITKLFLEDILLSKILDSLS
jgi:hypothetical protein